ncbi:hypothetical protein MBLNU457_4873t1 [Dothideomycetes sp. NU457]
MNEEDPEASTSEQDSEDNSDEFAETSHVSRSNTNGVDTDGEEVLDTQSADNVERITEAPKAPRRTRNKLNPKKARLRGFTTAYRDLYNDEIVDANRRHDLDPVDSLQPSQIGGSVWTIEEKQRLFDRLPRLGRHDVRRLSAAVGSKTEAEVHEFLLLLGQGSVESSLSVRQQGLGPEEVPAAVEVPPECERTLDRAAKAMAYKVEQLDQEVAQKRHGETWLLTSELADEIEKALDNRDSQRSENRTVTRQSASAQERNADEQNIAETVPPAKLLHLGNWLELSRLFMESAAERDEGWWSLLGSEDDEPSIYHTAFADFENLAVMLTTRLIQTAIFQAMSRIRASDQVKPGLNVRRQDVVAATQVLKLNDNWSEFWIGCARRNQIKVHANRRVKAGDDQQTGKGIYSNSRFVDFEKRKRSRNGYLLTYDEVEAALRTSGDWTEEPPSIPDIESNPPPSSEEALDDQDMYDNSDFWTEGSDDGRPQDSATYTRDQREQERIRNQAEDAYLEALDQKASEAETARLWSILNYAPKDVKKEEEEEEETDLPHLPSRKRKRVVDLRDWVEETQYQSYWEMNEEPLDLQAFNDMDRRGQAGKKRRQEAYAQILEHANKSGYSRDEEIEESDLEDRVSPSEDSEVEEIVQDEGEDDDDDDRSERESHDGSRHDESASEALDLEAEDASPASGQEDDQDGMDIDAQDEDGRA